MQFRCDVTSNAIIDKLVGETRQFVYTNGNILSIQTDITYFLVRKIMCSINFFIDAENSSNYVTDCKLA